MCGVETIQSLPCSDTHMHTTPPHSPTHLGEIANYMEAILVPFCHDVEQEGVCIVVESLVVQKEFGKQAQVLCISLWYVITCSACVCAQLYAYTF